MPQNLLTERFLALQRAFPKLKQTGILRDGRGVYAFAMVSPKGHSGYFFAKRSMAGPIVSVHRVAFERAKNEKALIYMAVADDFYGFDPAKLKIAYVNERYGTPMTNFRIEWGMRIDLPKATAGPTLFDPESKKGKIVGALEKEFGAVVVQ